VGPGVVPRPIPFTQDFVFLRERHRERMQTLEGLELVYDVYRGSFETHETFLVGELRALQRPHIRGGESPVRWMVVGESEEGFVLQGENLETFPLPTPIWTPGGGEASRQRPG